MTHPKTLALNAVCAVFVIVSASRNGRLHGARQIVYKSMDNTCDVTVMDNTGDVTLTTAPRHAALY